MAGLETVVRPVIFPNIRPTPTRSLVPEDDPDKGICVIRGSSAKQVTLSNSTNISSSKRRPSEIRRRVDEVRIYQMDDETGEVDHDTYIDVEVPTRIDMEEPAAGPQAGHGTPGVGSDPTGGGRSPGAPTVQYHFARQRELENIEIRKRDKMVKNPDAP